MRCGYMSSYGDTGGGVIFTSVWDLEISCLYILILETCGTTARLVTGRDRKVKMRDNFRGAFEPFPIHIDAMSASCISDLPSSSRAGYSVDGDEFET
jgi:hypothetical protein